MIFDKHSSKLWNQINIGTKSKQKEIKFPLESLLLPSKDSKGLCI
jgi:hypothetical protein